MGLGPSNRTDDRCPNTCLSFDLASLPTENLRYKWREGGMGILYIPERILLIPYPDGTVLRLVFCFGDTND